MMKCMTVFGMDRTAKNDPHIILWLELCFIACIFGLLLSLTGRQTVHIGYCAPAFHQCVPLYVETLVHTACVPCDFQWTPLYCCQ